MNALQTILSTDVLAEQLGSPGEILILCPKEAPEHELERWYEAKRSNPGHFYSCGACGSAVLLKKHPRGGFYCAHAPNTDPANRCPFCTHRQGQVAVELNALDAELTNAGPCLQDIRLKRRLAHFQQKPESMLGPIRRDEGSEPKPRTARQRRSPRSLLGFCMLLCEGTGLNRCWPGRDYATDFPQLIPRIGSCIGEAENSGNFGGLTGKIVLPECAVDFASEVTKSCQAGDAASPFGPRAIIIGRLFRHSQVDDQVQVTLTGMRDVRLTIPATLWDACQKAFGQPLVPGARTGFETLFAAIVCMDEDGNIRVEELAWVLFNRLGVPVFSTFEADTLAELEQEGYTFIRPLCTKLRVGPWTMLVDFIIRIPITDWTILEVDPKKSGRKKKSKRRRMERCVEAKSPALSYDPCAGQDVRAAITALWGKQAGVK